MAEAVTDFNKKQMELEKSCQELEKVELEGPYAIAMHEMRLDAALTSLDRGLRQMADKERHAEFDGHRSRVLSDLDFEIEHTNRRRELAEARERASVAQSRAERQERAASVQAKRDAFSWQAEAEPVWRAYEAKPEQPSETKTRGDQSRVNGGDDDVPPEVREAMARHAEIRKIRRWFDKERKAILDQVGGDESRLSERQREELEELEEAEAFAQEKTRTAAAAGLVFPFGDD